MSNRNALWQDGGTGFSLWITPHLLQLRRDRHLLIRVLLHFRIDIGQHIPALFGVQLLFEPPQRNSDHITVVKLRARPARAQFQPQPMHQIDILRPQARRVRTQIEKQRLARVGQNHFQRQ